MAVAIDFTRSNKGPEHPGSFHCMDLQSESAYTTAIRAVGEVMRSFDNDGYFPVYGFGAKIPPSNTVCSDCFALNGDFYDPEVKGIDGVIQAYKRALRIVHLHGPTRLAEVIKLTADSARPYSEVPEPGGPPIEMKYFVLLILTDGKIDDEVAVINEVVKASGLPMSLVIIGIGDEDFTFLKDLANGVGQVLKKEDAPVEGDARTTGRTEDSSAKLHDPFAGRDLVHFVAYEDFRGKPTELASAALQEVPREVVGYFNGKKIKPANIEKLEDKSGKPADKFSAVDPKLRPIDKKPTDQQDSRTGFKQKQNSKDAPPGSRNGSKNGPLAIQAPESKASSHGTAASKAFVNDMPPEEQEIISPEEEEKLRIASLPPFLKEEKSRLWDLARKLGYDGYKIKRAFTDGVAAGTLQSLLDNVMHAGYGKLPTFKEAAEKAIPDEDTSRLPGQPLPEWDQRVASNTSVARSNLASSDRSSFGTGSMAVAAATKAMVIKEEGHLDTDLLGHRLSLMTRPTSGSHSRTNSKVRESPQKPVREETSRSDSLSHSKGDASARRVMLLVDGPDAGSTGGSRKCSRHLSSSKEEGRRSRQGSKIDEAEPREIGPLKMQLAEAGPSASFADAARALVEDAIVRGREATKERMEKAGAVGLSAGPVGDLRIAGQASEHDGFSTVKQSQMAPIALSTQDLPGTVPR